MKLFTAFFFLISIYSGVSANPSSNCLKPISILFGPLFSPSYVNLNFSDIRRDTFRETGCEVLVGIAENRDVYFEGIRDKNFGMVLISSVHLNGIERIGYKHLVSGFGPIEVVLVSKKRSGIQQPKDLIGKLVLLNSDINIPAVVWRQYAKNHALTEKVRYGYPANIDSLIFELMKNKGDAVVTYIGFYNRLSPNLKQKLNLLYRREMTHPGTIVTSERISKDIRQRLKSAFIRSDKWDKGRPKPDVQADSIVNKKLKALLQSN